jgi:hypothetical protein
MSKNLSSITDYYELCTQLNNAKTSNTIITDIQLLEKIKDTRLDSFIRDKFMIMVINIIMVELGLRNATLQMLIYDNSTPKTIEVLDMFLTWLIQKPLFFSYSNQKSNGILITSKKTKFPPDCKSLGHLLGFACYDNMYYYDKTRDRVNLNIFLLKYGNTQRMQLYCELGDLSFNPNVKQLLNNHAEKMVERYQTVITMLKLDNEYKLVIDIKDWPKQLPY